MCELVTPNLILKTAVHKPHRVYLPSVSHLVVDFSAQIFTVRSFEAVARKEPEGAMLTCVTYLGSRQRRGKDKWTGIE